MTMIENIVRIPELFCFQKEIVARAEKSENAGRRRKYDSKLERKHANELSCKFKIKLNPDMLTLGEQQWMV